MAANNRSEAAKKLTEQLNELMRVKPNRRAARKLAAPSGGLVGPVSTFVKANYPRGGDWLEKQPMGKREFWRLIFGAEAAQGYSTMTPDEKHALVVKMKAGFSDAERAALAAYDEAAD